MYIKSIDKLYLLIFLLYYDIIYIENKRRCINMRVGEEILFNGVVYVIVDISRTGEIQLKRRD